MPAAGCWVRVQMSSPEPPGAVCGSHVHRVFFAALNRRPPSTLHRYNHLSASPTGRGGRGGGQACKQSTQPLEEERRADRTRQDLQVDSAPVLGFEVLG